MAVSSVNTSNPLSALSPSNPGQVTPDAAGLAQNFDSFLTLLTTQLKNQDPLSPQDSTQWVTQLVQFSSVEQQINQTQALQNLLNLQLAFQTSNAVGFIGKTVDVSGENIFLKDSKAEVRYSLDDDATKTTIAIKDSTGKVVREITGEATKGPHTLTWDGKDKDGVLLPDGHYTISVSATKGQNVGVGVTTTFSGVVTAIENSGIQVVLRVGDSRIPIADVTSVRETPAG